MNATSIETHGGRYFDYATPTDPRQVVINDVAASLSQTARFRAFTKQFYSVAEHAVLVSRLVRNAFNAELAYAALHHDSHEAYIGDTPSPLKPVLGPLLERLALQIDEAVAEAFDINVNLFDHDAVKAADIEAMQIEAAVLKHSKGVWIHRGFMSVATVPEWAVRCWVPRLAEQRFLDWHYGLRRELGL